MDTPYSVFSLHSLALISTPIVKGALVENVLLMTSFRSNEATAASFLDATAETSTHFVKELTATRKYSFTPTEE